MAAPRLLLSLPRELLLSTLGNHCLSLSDLAALERSCTALAERSVAEEARLIEAAARAAAALLLRHTHCEHALQYVLCGRSGKRALCFAAALVEGQRNSIAAGGAHTLAVTRKLTEPPAKSEAVALSTIAGDWIESFNGSLLRIWVIPGGRLRFSSEAREVAYGIFLDGDGEIRGELGRGSTGRPELCGVWRQHGEELGQGRFEFSLSPCGRRLLGTASSHTGWTGKWTASRVGLYPGLPPSLAATARPAGAALAMAGLNADGQCGQQNGKRVSLQPSGPTGLEKGAVLAGVFAGESHSALLCTDGTMYMAGSNRYQALGLDASAVGVHDYVPQLTTQGWMNTISMQHGWPVQSEGNGSSSSQNPSAAESDPFHAAAFGAAAAAVDDALARSLSEAAPGSNLRGIITAFQQYYHDDSHVYVPPAPAESNWMTWNSDSPPSFCRWVPVPWPNGATVTVRRVSLGSRHTLAVAEDGALWSWGCNSAGQTGAPPTLAHHGPTKQAVLRWGGCAEQLEATNLSEWGSDDGQWLATDVAAGHTHSLVLLRDGKVKLLGTMDDGPFIASLPSSMAGWLYPPLSTSTDGSDSGASEHHISSVSGQPGAGPSSDGRFAGVDSAPLMSAFTNALMQAFGVLSLSEYSEASWGTDSRPLGISAGITHSLVLTSSGRVLSAGNGSYGQLGHSASFSPSPPIGWMQVPDNVRVAAVAAGGFRSAILSDMSELYMCGDNDCGQCGSHEDLGHGIRLPRHVPLPAKVLQARRPALPASLFGLHRRQRRACMRASFIW